MFLLIEFFQLAEQKDVFLDEFADTDSAPSDEDEEAQVLRAERRAKRDAQAKGKSKSKVNPLTAPKYGYGYGAKAKEQGFKLKESDLALLGQDVDVASMAPSTLVLELRRRKREAKRVNRSEARRSNLRASTLATAAAAATDPDAAQGEADAEEDDGKNKGRRGRVAQHIAATRTIRKPLTQSQLIEAALEEEERNKEALRDWLKKEEEKRELRRVGRKVVKGPRWTWVSRTVGRLVEEIPEPAEAEKGEESELNGEGKQEARLDEAEERQGEQEKPQGEAEKSQGETSPKTPAPPSEEQSKVPAPPSAEKAATETTLTPLNPPAPPEQKQQQQSTETQTQPPPPAQSETNAPYTRNYIILSQIPGGLPAELQVVLGSHVEWDKLKVIPSRNRPISAFSFFFISPFFILFNKGVYDLSLTDFSFFFNFPKTRPTNTSLPVHQPTRQIPTSYHPHPVRHQRRIPSNRSAPAEQVRMGRTGRLVGCRRRGCLG